MRISDWSSDVCSSDLVPAQGHDGVSRLDGAGGDLGKEGLVGHVGQRVDDGDLRLATTKLLLQLPGCVETCVSATDGEDSGQGSGHGGRRTEEGRVGTEWVSTVRSRLSRDH